ncbi:selenocysteine-specific translation elongation factor [Urbifossiella limnaea]|uniref:Selenocysteine-specific elongation factor n=1 Tax=Urbifossiella limnaea TaxID=2528023 RepID=A0A517XS37_9BACT|nr:selenocysteine-specific translation elongation factor [Urbifossiella limnaea]QDU20303.1 Selenocysteine-specific elongation factor [Urbifossiella limnaea]
MPRHLILGTAGHIDHGKTTLVRALTGTDTDRLPEEKARGITIDIGFARLALGDLELGVVDVPGHERFVRNMLAGATGVDIALLVVAADDSVMPQTREHLDILHLLGVRAGVVAVTKADLVDDTTREVVTLEVRELLRGTGLEAAAVVPVSAHTGEGIDALRAALRAAAEAVPDGRDGAFRLPIDRAFVVQGHGTVVTGSVLAGRVRVGDELDWHTGDGAVERVRVRGLNHHGAAVPVASRGQRAAVNLAGVPHERVRRGQELAAPGAVVPSTVLTVRLRVARGSPRPLKHRLPLRVHIGTAEVMGTVSLLDSDRLDPGGTGPAQLFLDAPVTAVWGQPFVVRDSSAEHTLGGGTILHPTARKLRRRHLVALERVERLESADPSVRFVAAAWFAGSAGLDPADLPRTTGVPAADIAAVTERATGGLVEVLLPPARRLVLAAERVAELEATVLRALGGLHAEFPLHTSHDRQKLAASLTAAAEEAVTQAVIDRLFAARQLVGDRRRVARADFKPKLSANQRKLKDRIVSAHAAAGFAPPEPREFAGQAGGQAAALTDIYDVAVAEGELVKLAADLYLHAAAAAELREKVLALLAATPGATVAAIRDALGTTRKYAVPICEYLDRIGLTRRDGDVRVLAAGPR